MIKKRKDLIPISNIIFQGNEVDYVMDAVESNWVSSIGPYIDKFEIDFAATMDCSFAVSVNNGTSALSEAPDPFPQDGLLHCFGVVT